MIRFADRFKRAHEKLHGFSREASRTVVEQAAPASTPTVKPVAASKEIAPKDLEAALKSLPGALRSTAARLRDVAARADVEAAPPREARSEGSVPRALGKAPAGYTALVTPAALTTLSATHEVNEQTSTVRSSAAALGLDVAGRAATRTSSAEMNTTPTYFEKTALTFSASSSTGTLSGTYTGTGAASGATSLRIAFTSPSVISGLVPTVVAFDVKDQSDQVVFSYSGAVRADEAISLGADIGLSLKLSAGSITAGSSDSLAVSSTQGTSVDANARFDETSPNLMPRFDAGYSVGAGSFAVNGATISVAASDTVSTVLGKINASAAGVTASLASDKITLTSNAPSAAPINLGGDTSGFLAATKLSGSTTVAGAYSDLTSKLSLSPKLAGASSGSFRVNGTTIAVDTAQDSLADVLSRIGASGAGVTAAYDATADRVTLTPNSAGARLTLDNDTTGLLALLGLSTGAKGTRVDRSAAFNGTDLGDPLFDPGKAVLAGSFKVNGVLILVQADDSIDSVLAKINASSAKVVASFDDATEKVKLTGTTADGNDIVLSDDTSGFLAAVKLDGTASRSVGRAYRAATQDRLLSELGGVSAGTITIGGRSIAIDPGVDTLRGVVASLRSLGTADVSLAEGSGVASIQGLLPGGKLDVADTTGLLAALGIGVGTLRGAPLEVHATAPAPRAPGRAEAKDVEGLADEVNRVIGLLVHAPAASRALADDVLAALRRELSAMGGHSTGLELLEGADGPRLVVKRGRPELGPRALAEVLEHAAEKLDVEGALARDREASPDRIQAQAEARAAVLRHTLASHAKKTAAEIGEALGDTLDQAQSAAKRRREVLAAYKPAAPEKEKAPDKATDARKQDLDWPDGDAPPDDDPHVDVKA